MCKTLNGVSPRVADSAFVSEQSYVIGDVTIGEYASCWPFVCLRGDSGSVVIGDETNVQEFSMIHSSSLGDHVTVGHNATVDNATVGDRSLVGIGSMILNNASIGDDCIVAGGCLVPTDMVIPDGHLATGIPASTQPVSDEQLAHVKHLGEHYVELSQQYKAAGGFE